MDVIVEWLFLLEYEYAEQFFGKQHWLINRLWIRAAS
jgi:hypothetical protein